MIEGDTEKYRLLCRTYAGATNVHCVNRFVESGPNSLGNILRELQIRDVDRIDFLSIDIDGLDYEIFEGLDFRPRLICIEVNAGHSPVASTALTRAVAANNVGQPLWYFSRVASDKGYVLVCYNGNAFYLREDVARSNSVPGLSDEEAYAAFLEFLNSGEKEWLFVVNCGLVAPYYRFGNPLLRAANLDIKPFRAFSLQFGPKRIKSRLFRLLCKGGGTE